MARRRGVPAVALFLLLGPVACGGDVSGAGATPRVDAKEVETLLVQRQRERNPRLKVVGASCPAEVPARPGQTFECTVDVEGEDAPFMVTVAEVLGQKARYDLRPLRAIVDVGGVADFLRSRLEEDWRTAKVDCGRAKVRIMEVVAAVECTVFNGTTTRYIQAVVEDRDGSVSLRER